MSRKIKLDSVELFGDFANPESINSGKEGFDSYWEWPDFFGNGFLGSIRLRPGLFLRIGNYKVLDELFISFDTNDEFFNFEFAVQGDILSNYQYNKSKNSIHMEPASFSISYVPGWRGNALISSSSSVELVGILIRHDTLRSFIGEEVNLLPEEIMDILYNGFTMNSFCKSYSVTKEMDIILREILFCPYKGVIRRLFLEGKAFELFSMALQNISRTFSKKRTTGCIKQMEVEKMFHIKRIVEENIQAPPSLEELAKDSGISHTRLNFCFRKIYGKTVFEHLRDVRLKRAKLLLDEGKANVTEAAYEVGYSNLSYFTKSFRNHFGTNPGEYLRRVSLEKYS